MDKLFEVLGAVLLVMGITFFVFWNGSFGNSDIPPEAGKLYQDCLNSFEGSTASVLASRTGNVSQCETVTDPVDRDSCRSSAGRNESECSKKILGTEEYAYCIAQLKSDVLFCDDQAIDPELRLKCKARITGDSSWCETITDPYLSIECATSTGTLNAQEHCIDATWSQYASISGKPESCNNIKNLALKTECLNSTTTVR